MVVGFFGREEGRGRVDDSALAMGTGTGTTDTAGIEIDGVVSGRGNGGANAFRLPVPIVFRAAGAEGLIGVELEIGVGLAEAGRREDFLHGKISSMGEETIVTFCTLGE